MAESHDVGPVYTGKFFTLTLWQNGGLFPLDLSNGKPKMLALSVPAQFVLEMEARIKPGFAVLYKPVGLADLAIPGIVFPSGSAEVKEVSPVVLGMTAHPLIGEGMFGYVEMKVYRIIRNPVEIWLHQHLRPRSRDAQYILSRRPIDQLRVHIMEGKIT